MDQDLQTKIFKWFAGRRIKIVDLFKYLYLAIAIFWVFAAYENFSNGNLEGFIYKTGVGSGKIALLLLGIVVLPGILGRFRIEIKLTRIITLFRRQLGIVAFLIAFTHFIIVRGFLYISGFNPFNVPLELLVVMGMSALFLLFLMFLTSNDTSKKRLGKWWKYLHRLIYLVLWLLVLHTGLQRISVWSVYIFIFASVEVASWAYYFLKKRV